MKQIARHTKNTLSFLKRATFSSSFRVGSHGRTCGKREWGLLDIAAAKRAGRRERGQLGERGEQPVRESRLRQPHPGHLERLQQLLRVGPTLLLARGHRRRRRRRHRRPGAGRSRRRRPHPHQAAPAAARRRRRSRWCRSGGAPSRSPQERHLRRARLRRGRSRRGRRVPARRWRRERSGRQRRGRGRGRGQQHLRPDGQGAGHRLPLHRADRGPHGGRHAPHRNEDGEDGRSGAQHGAGAGGAGEAHAAPGGARLRPGAAPAALGHGPAPACPRHRHRHRHRRRGRGRGRSGGAGAALPVVPHQHVVVGAAVGVVGAPAPAPQRAPALALQQHLQRCPAAAAAGARPRARAALLLHGALRPPRQAPAQDGARGQRERRSEAAGRRRGRELPQQLQVDAAAPRRRQGPRRRGGAAALSRRRRERAHLVRLHAAAHGRLQRLHGPVRRPAAGRLAGGRRPGSVAAYAAALRGRVRQRSGDAGAPGGGGEQDVARRRGLDTPGRGPRRLHPPPARLLTCPPISSQALLYSAFIKSSWLFAS